MSGAASLPQPGFDPDRLGDSSGGMSPQRTLSTRDWDPVNPVFDQQVVADMRERLGSLQVGIMEESRHLEVLGPRGLIVPGVDLEYPEHWSETRGSPAFYLRAAEGYVRAAMQGTVCRKAHPPSSRSEHPPPSGQWCCEHVPPHCE